MRSTPKMKVMPADTRNSHEANAMPSIRMIAAVFIGSPRLVPLPCCASALLLCGPALDPVDRLHAGRRVHLLRREHLEAVEDRITELRVLLAGGEPPHGLV